MVSQKRKPQAPKAHRPKETSKRRRTTAEEASDVTEESGSEVDGLSKGEEYSDEGEEEGEEEDDGESEGGKSQRIGDQSTKEGRSSKAHVPPTMNEIRQISEASALFKSNTFKLQIDALLPNVRPKNAHIAPLERFLLVLHTFLMGLPSSEPSHPLEASRKLLKSGVAVPYPLPLPTEESKWTVQFMKPQNILVAGSWANKLGVKGREGLSIGVDLALEMPSELFQEKDYLNARFFHRRAYYLAHLAKAIKSKKSGLNVDVTYDCAYYDPRLTSLVLRPKPDGSQTDFTKLGAFVRLVPAVTQDSGVALRHLDPSKSSLRLSNVQDNSDSSLPTPMYNNALLTCVTPKPGIVDTYTLLQDIPSVRDAVALLRVWANQRGYCAGSNCIIGFENSGAFWFAILQYLLVGGKKPTQKNRSSTRKPLGKGLSSYQFFRAALDFLSKHNFRDDPVYMAPFKAAKAAVEFLPESYQNNYRDGIFVDWFAGTNLLANIPLNSLDMLRYDAKLTLDTLDNGTTGVEPFSEVFMQDQRDPLTRFDLVIQIDMEKAELRNASIRSSLDAGSSARHTIFTLSTLLRKALNNRVKAIALVGASETSRPIDQAHPPNHAASTYCVGLILDPEHAFRIVDHGPPHSDVRTDESKQFQELWGPKAELRRFKDGRIQESVVWDVKNSDARAGVPAMVVQHILEYHFNLPAESVRTYNTKFDDILRFPEPYVKLALHNGIPAGFKSALVAFDNLVKDVKALDEELPLAVLNVNPTSSYLRYTSVFAPVALPSQSVRSLPAFAQYVPTMDIVLQFERSARWPDDLAAIQKMKLAFYERIGSALMGKRPGLRARVAVTEDTAVSDITAQGHLEVLTAEGWAFRARIWHDREATLLDQQMGPKNPVAKRAQATAESERQRKRAEQALFVYLKQFVHAPKHHHAVAALSHHFPAYAGTVRLMKRWLAAHWLLDGHVGEEAVELICARVFIGEGVALNEGEEWRDRPGVQASKELGFARVISFLKDWSWDAGLVVPIYRKARHDGDGAKIAPPIKAGECPGVWVLQTEEDPSGRLWTSEGPTILSANRIKDLAKATARCLQHISQGHFDPKVLFVHPQKDYDVLIHLDPNVVPRCHQNINRDVSAWKQKSKYANLPSAARNSEEDIRISFDPVNMFFRDLKRIYAGTLEFFYDAFGGVVIGAVWDPSVNQARPFRVLGAYSSVPSTESSKNKSADTVQVNKSAIIAEIMRLGAGLLKSIDLN